MDDKLTSKPLGYSFKVCCSKCGHECTYIEPIIVGLGLNTDKMDAKCQECGEYFTFNVDDAIKFSSL